VFRTGDSTVARTSNDGRYWFFFIVPRSHVGSWFLQPEHLFVMAAAIGLCYWLALYLTRPVRKLQKAVERFGRGDLSAARERPFQTNPNFAHLRLILTESKPCWPPRLLLDISHEPPAAGPAVCRHRTGSPGDDVITRSTGYRRNPTGSTRW
jgi:hypothetical protein